MSQPFACLRHLPRFLALLLLCLALPAAAQQIDFEAKLEAWDQRLDAIEAVVAEGDLDEEVFAAIREELLALIDEAHAAAGSVSATAGVTQQMIDALGPPPVEGEPPEPEIIAKERQRLAESLSTMKTRARRADLAATRAQIILSTANAQRMAIFADALFRQGPLPLSPETWALLPEQIGYLKDLLLDAESATPTSIDADLRLLLVGAGVLAFGIGLPLRRWLARRFGFRPAVTAPTYGQRVLATVVVAAVRGLMPAIATLLLFFGLLALLGDHPFAGVIERVAGAACAGLVFFFFCSGLGRAICAPDHPDWRIAEVDPAVAGQLNRRLYLMSATLGLVGAVMMVLDRLPVPPEIYAIVFFVLVVLTSATLVALVARVRSGAATRSVAPDAGRGGATPGAPPPGAIRLSDGAPPLEDEAPVEKARLAEGARHGLPGGGGR